MNHKALRTGVLSAASALGAPYLFGDEWLHYFAFFGSWGAVGVILVAVGMVWATASLLLFLTRKGIASQRELWVHLFGKRAAPSLSFLLSCMLLLCVSMFFWQQAKALTLYLGAPGWLGLVLVACAVLVFMRMIPSTRLYPLALLTLILGLAVLLLLVRQQHVPLPPLTHQFNFMWLWHAIFYLSFHCLFVLAVLLPPVAGQAETPDKKSLYAGSVIGGLLFATIALLGHFALLAHWHEIHSLDQPLFAFLLQRSPWLVPPFLLIGLLQTAWLCSVLLRFVCRPLIEESELRETPLVMLFLFLALLIAGLAGGLTQYPEWIQAVARLVGFAFLFRLLQVSTAKSP